jgi:ribonuclease BN (tRNA processing enzyme)
MGGDRLVVVGCGTVVPEGSHGASCYFAALDGARILLDCGPGALQALARLDLPLCSLTDVVLTHFHADHIGALPGFLFACKHGLAAPRRTPLHVWGPVGTAGLFERLDAAFGPFIRDPGFPLLIHEILPGAETVLAGGSRLLSHKTPHTDESLAYRIEGRAGGVGYSGDTGPSDSLGPFMRSVDVFVCECSLPDDQPSDIHLTPARVARIASAAAPDLLVLTHIYPHLRERGDAAELVRAAGYGGAASVASEGLEVRLSSA